MAEKDERPPVSVSMVIAATMVTLACNTVAQAENTDEGTPSRRVKLKDCDKTFSDMRRCANENRDKDPEISKILDEGADAYDLYLSKHKTVMDMDKDDPARVSAIDAANKAMDALDLKMADMLRAF